MNDGTPNIGCFDTMSQVSIQNDSYPLPPNTKIISENDGTTIEGVGGMITEAGTLYSVEISLRLGTAPITFEFRLAPLSTPGLRWLWDIAQMRSKLGAIYDSNRNSLRTELTSTTIRLEPIAILHQRMTSPPIRILSAGNPTGSELYTLLEMGNTVTEYLCIDTDPSFRTIITDLFATTKTKIAFTDHISSFDCKNSGPFDIAWFSPASGPWIEHRNGSETSFSDPQASVFRHCSRIASELLTMNPATSIIFSTNRISKDSTKALTAQQMWSGPNFFSVDASDIGSPSKSHMRFSIRNLPVRFNKPDFHTSDPNHFLQAGYRSTRSPTAPITNSLSKPIMVTDNKGTNPRKCSLNESDSLMGYPPGFSKAFKPSPPTSSSTFGLGKGGKGLGKGNKGLHDNVQDTSKPTIGTLYSTQDQLRLKFLSKCSNQYHLRLILRYLGLQISPPANKVTRLLQSAINPVENHPDKLELHLANMSHLEKVKFIVAKFQGYDWTQVQLDIEVTHDTPYQTRRIPDVHRRFEKSVLKSLTTSIARQHIAMKTEHKSSDWLSPMFFKGKKTTLKDGTTTDRLDSDGDIVVRKLCAPIVLNSYVKIHSWWREFCPKMEDFRAQFHSVDKHFSLVDLADAFEFIKLTKRSHQYMVFVFRMNGKLYYVQALVAMQGLSLSGFFFPVALFKLLTHAFGLSWLLWFAIYVDDITVKGPTTDRTTNRGHILLAFCQAVKLPISPKTPLPLSVNTEVSAVGWVIDQHGSRADDTVVIATTMKLQSTVTTLKQARYLRGVVQAAAGAWEFTPGNARSMAEMMAPWHAAISPTEGRPFKWTDECRQRQIDMIPFLKSLPRSHINPDELITDESCIIYVTDSSDDASGCSIWRVMIPDARDVIVPEDLEDPQLSKIVWNFAKAHTSEQKEWLTYTNETEILIVAIEKTSNRVTQALLKFDPDSPIRKIGFYSDSSTARSIAEGLTNPAFTPEYHTAKARKWLNWSQRVVMTNHWPSHWAFIQGIKNTLADWLSHVGHLILDQGDIKTRLTKTTSVMTRAQSTLYDSAQSKYPVPDGWTIANSTFKLFTIDDWKLVSETTKADTKSTWFKITIADMFAKLTSSSALAPLVSDRIDCWKTKVFAICPPGSSWPCLFVPKTFTRSESAHFDSDERLASVLDMTELSANNHRELVLVIPADLDLRISQIPPLDGAKPHCLRTDLITLFHEFNSHPNPATTFESVSNVAWWPAIRKIINDHILYCSLCMKRSSWRRLAGMGTIFRYRHRHLWGDHLILPPWIKDITGIGAIFVILDVGSGETDACSTESTGACEVVAWLFNHWIRSHGFFYTFGSDHGSAFEAKVTATFFKLIGLKIHKRSAVNDSRGMANVENKNKLLRTMEAEISENSSIQSRLDLDYFITRHIMFHNQTRKTAGSTVFERCRGEPAIQLGDLLTAEIDIGADMKTLTDDEASLLTRVATVTNELMQDYKVEQQIRSRANAYERDTRDSRKRGTHPKFTIGQQLSLKGKKVTVLDLEGFDGTSHIVATILEDGHTIPRRVKCDDLRERCWPTPQWTPPKIPSAKPGQLILFEDDDPDGYRRAGLVLDVTDEHCHAHEYAPNSTVTRWLPVWISPTGKQDSSRKCPSTWTALITTVKWSQIVLTGSLLKESLSEDTKRRAISSGHDWALPRKTAND
jgi:hypothetical protein